MREIKKKRKTNNDNDNDNDADTDPIKYFTQHINAI